MSLAVDKCRIVFTIHLAAPEDGRSPSVGSVKVRACFPALFEMSNLVSVLAHVSDHSIISERLELVPMSPDFLRASIGKDLATASNILCASLPADWPEAPDFL